MKRFELHYSPDQLRELNDIVRDRFMEILKAFHEARETPKELRDKERLLMDNYFEDIDTILKYGQFIAFEKGGIIDEMLT